MATVSGSIEPYHSKMPLPESFFIVPDVPITSLDENVDKKITYTSRECLRIMYQGSNRRYLLGNFTSLICSVPQIMEYIADRNDQQKHYGNTNPSHTYIDRPHYNSTHLLQLPADFEQLLRYLTLTERIAGYAPAKLGYCLFSTKDAIDFRGDYSVFTRGKLKIIDDYMSSLEFPEAPNHFSQRQKDLLQQAYTEIKDKYYARVTYFRNEKMAEWLTIHLDSEVEEMMNFLVQKRVIASWNAANGTYADSKSYISIKFHNSHGSYDVARGRGWQFDIWRGS